MSQKIKSAWEYLQSLADVDGDCIMLAFSVVVMWKILHVGLNASDAAAYASAIGAFAYSNTGGKGPRQS